MRTMTLILLLLFSTASLSCGTVKTIYLNDSQKVYAGSANQTIASPFDYVLMSKGRFRDLTNITLEDGVYTCTKQ